MFHDALVPFAERRIITMEMLEKLEPVFDKYHKEGRNG